MPAIRYFHAHETARFDALSGLPLASFRRRAYALAIDFALIALIKLPFHLGHHHAEAAAAEHGWEHWIELGVEEFRALAESVLYFAVTLKLGRGQTPGKRLLKIRVLSLSHHEIGWWQSIERALGYGASLLEGGFGFLQYFIHRNRMCVHDRIAETIVVSLTQPAITPEPHTPDADPAPKSLPNS